MLKKRPSIFLFRCAHDATHTTRELDIVLGNHALRTQSTDTSLTCKQITELTCKQITE